MISMMIPKLTARDAIHSAIFHGVSGTLVGLENMRGCADAMLGNRAYCILERYSGLTPEKRSWLSFVYVKSFEDNGGN